MSPRRQLEFDHPAFDMGSQWSDSNIPIRFCQARWRMPDSKDRWKIWVFGGVLRTKFAFHEPAVLRGGDECQIQPPDCSIEPADLPMADPPSRCYGASMAVFLSTFILPVAVAAVALVLLMGLVNMMRGGSPNRSQQLMRLRVLLQFVAIVVIMVTIWAMGR
jgi:Hypoxia induced protein conserved region